MPWAQAQRQHLNCRLNGIDLWADSPASAQLFFVGAQWRKR
jgi:hypothetical protein